MIFSVRPSTSSAARERKSSARSASNSANARKLSRSESGVGCADGGAAASVVADERELLEPVDGEEDRGVRRVEHLVPASASRADLPVQVALRLRAEVELGLLD